MFKVMCALVAGLIPFTIFVVPFALVAVWFPMAATAFCFLIWMIRNDKD